MSSEGKFKKRFDEIALKGCLDPNDVGKDLENLLDEAKKEFPLILQGRIVKSKIACGDISSDIFSIADWFKK